MKYFIDTEYVFTAGSVGGSISPLSIGIVAEDGRSYYAVCEYAVDKTEFWHLPSFVKEHVIPALSNTGRPSRPVAAKSLEWIRDDLLRFIGDDKPEFWGDYADFDYVVLSIIMGGFDNWPDGWPMFINDMQQGYWPQVHSEVPHNALADARALYESWHQVGIDLVPADDDAEEEAAAAEQE